LKNAIIGDVTKIDPAGNIAPKGSSTKYPIIFIGNESNPNINVMRKSLTVTSCISALTSDTINNRIKVAIARINPNLIGDIFFFIPQV
jgi:hypothetical protein